MRPPFLIHIFLLLISFNNCYAGLSTTVPVKPGSERLQVKLEYFSQSKSGYNLRFSIPKKTIGEKSQGLLLIQSARESGHLITRAVLDKGEKKDVYDFKFFLSEEGSKNAFLQISREHGLGTKYEIDVRAFIEEAKQNEATIKLDNKSQ